MATEAKTPRQILYPRAGVKESVNAFEPADGNGCEAELPVWMIGEPLADVRLSRGGVAAEGGVDDLAGR